MQGRRLQETGGVFSEIRRGFLGAENDADAGRSFAAVEWHYSDRLLARIIHEGFYCNRRCLTQARRARLAGRRRVDLVHLVYLVCLVQPNKRDRPDIQERPAGPRACRAPFRHFAKNRHEQRGLSSQSASGTRGKSTCLRAFLPIDLYKNTRRERLNLYRPVRTPDTWPTWASINDATATHENTATARHHTASRPRRRYRLRCPRSAGFSQYIGTKGAHDRTVLLRSLNIVPFFIYSRLTSHDVAS
jgi:hypothetical protein